MNKQLTPLEELQFIRQFEISDDHRTLNDHVICRQSFDNIETALKDFEWLKSKISIDWFDKLPTDDKFRVMKIMGVEIDYD